MTMSPSTEPIKVACDTCRNRRQRLFVPQRGHDRYACGPARRDVAGEQGERGQSAGDPSERGPIIPIYERYEARQDTSHHDRYSHAEDDADRDEHQTLAE